MYRVPAAFFLAALLVVAAQDASEEEEEGDEEEDTEPPPPDGPPLVPMCELLTSRGYKCEEHVVTSKDGYKLDLFHLTCDATPKGPVVLLVPGLMTTAEIYVLKNDSIGFQLCDEGIDVWIYNTRGTYHGRKHEKLDPNVDGQFWDFSYTEIGLYDAPAAVNYIKEKTKAPQIYYLGHSLGATTLFTMVNTNPEMAESIKEAILFAPVFYATKFQMMLKEGSSSHDMLLQTMKEFDEKKLWEAFPRSDVEKNEHQIRCTDLPEMMIGYCNMAFDMSKPVIGDFMPAGTSKRLLEHMAQTYVKGKIAYFDWGSEEENTKKYGVPTAAEFDSKKATMKVNLFYCESDHIVAVQDIETLKEELVNLGVVHYIEEESFNHVDYLLPTSDENKPEYDKIMEKVKEIIK